MARTVGKESITIGDTATPIGSGIDVGILPELTAIIQCDPIVNFAVRFWPDATNPSTAAGVVLQGGDTMTFSNELDKLRFISLVPGSHAQLNIIYKDLS